MDNKQLVLSCIGAIKIKMHRIPVGTLKRCTIVRDVDQWYCCITTTDDGIEKRPIANVNATKPVGIDVGLLNWLTLSDGKVIPNNKLDFATQAKKIRQLQRNLSRKQNYKVERLGGWRIIVVNPSGTSQKCSGCGVVKAKEKLDLSVRTFECHSCGLVIDRDLNAAKNILKLGLEQSRAETEPLLIRQQQKRISKFQSRKQEAHE